MTSTAEVRSPFVAVLAGPAGVGKTTLARALARHTGAALLDLDTATAPLVGVVASLLGSTDLDGEVLARATRRARYEVLVDLAVDCLSCGTSAVLVAPFTAERQSEPAWRQVRSRLHGAGGISTLVWVHASREVLRERLLGRAAARDAGKLADLDAHVAGIDLRAPVVPHVAVDTGVELDVEALAAVLGGVRAQAG